jgi:hypothetical protein
MSDQSASPSPTPGQARSRRGTSSRGRSRARGRGRAHGGSVRGGRVTKPPPQPHPGRTLPPRSVPTPTSIPSIKPHLSPNRSAENNLRLQAATLLIDTKVNPTALLPFSRPSEPAGVFSPIWAIDIEDSEGWWYSSLGMWLNAEKAKTLNRLKEWRKILQRKALPGESVRGLLVQADSKDGDERKWAEGKYLQKLFMIHLLTN